MNRNVNRNMNVNRNVNRNMNVNRNVNVNRVGGVGYHGGVYRGAWVGRPYRWAPGGAIAAGAAIGVIAAGTAVAWAPPPPQPGLCWYYYRLHPTERLLGHLPVRWSCDDARGRPPAIRSRNCGCFDGWDARRP